MKIFSILEKKKINQPLSKDEINFVVENFTNNKITDGQMGALLMAICLNGLTREETSHLTLAMANSGEILDLSDLGLATDKHSTGGVGDKLTLTVAPMVAACGLVMAKMSGKSLGHTGGTIDKLAAIPNFKTDLAPDVFRDILRHVGVCIASQSANLAPADKVIYALRDSTATVDNISLIAASIMSKKIAAGAETIVLDIKVGSGAFMKSLPEARQLAQVMVDIGKDCGRKMSAVITAMDAPLGYAVGNALEVIEAVEVLKGEEKGEIRDLSIELTAHILHLAKGLDLDKARENAAGVLDDGTAFKKFAEMVEKQGGNTEYIHDTTKFILPRMTALPSPQKAYIQAINGEICGHAAHICSAQNTDLLSGIIFGAKPGDFVAKGQPLAHLYTDDPAVAAQALALLETAYTFSDTPPEKTPLVYEVIQ